MYTFRTITLFISGILVLSYTSPCITAEVLDESQDDPAGNSG